jgi:hypothetical protein
MADPYASTVRVVCAWCGMVSHKRTAEIDRQRRRGKTRFFCTLSHAARFGNRMRIGRHIDVLAQANPYTSVEIAWLAGLLEGEGSFLPAPPSSPGTPRIQMQSTDEDVVAKVARLFHVSYHQKHVAGTVSNTGITHRKDSYTVAVRGSRAIYLMQRLRPLMGTRRKQQIEQSLSAYEARR